MSDGEPGRRQIPPVINDGCKRSVTGANFRAEGESEFGKCDLSYE